MGPCLSAQRNRDLNINSILQNHLILEKLLEYMRVKDLKKCRLVNKQWKESFSSAFFEKSRKTFHESDYCQHLNQYIKNTPPNQGHVNYSLVICDIKGYERSLELLGIFMNRYTELKDIYLDFDASKLETWEQFITICPNLKPQTSLKNLKIKLFSNKRIKDQINLSLLAKKLMKLFPNVSSIEFCDMFGPESFDSVFLEEIINFPGALKNLTSAKFDLPLEYPYNTRCVHLLAQLPHKMKKLDLGFLSPQSNDVGKAIENCLAQHAESLESFKVDIGNAREQFVVNFPTMKKLQVLEIFHKKNSHTIVKEDSANEWNGVHFTQIQVGFNFGGLNFMQKMPALRKLGLIDYFGQETDIIARRPSTELLDCFFGNWPENQVCDRMMKIEIGNIWVDDNFFEKLGQSFPNAKIVKKKKFQIGLCEIEDSI